MPETKKEPAKEAKKPPKSTGLPDFEARIVALEEMIDRLVEDNENAKLLGRGLNEIHGIGIDVERVRTNIIFFEIDHGVGPSAQDVAYFLRTKHNILVDVAGTYKIRLVTHYWVGTAEIDKLVHALEKAIQYAGESN